MQVRFLRWPSPKVWRGILRALSRKLGRDPRYSAIDHLAANAARQGVAPHVARDYVEDLLVQHVGEIALECGLGYQHAAAICARLGSWLTAVQQASSIQPYWPSRAEWIELNHIAAGLAYMDARWTISANLASYVALRDGLTHAAAKRSVHACIARHANHLARQVGLGWVEALGIQIRLVRALDSFDP